MNGHAGHAVKRIGFLVVALQRAPASRDERGRPIDVSGGRSVLMESRPGPNYR